MLIFMLSGQRAAAFGTCPQVGVAGHLHGGFGFSSLRWGLFLDQVVEMEVVTSNGSIVTANNHTNSDLFWVSTLPLHLIALVQAYLLSWSYRLSAALHRPSASSQSSRCSRTPPLLMLRLSPSRTPGVPPRSRLPHSRFSSISLRRRTCHPIWGCKSGTRLPAPFRRSC